MRVAIITITRNSSHIWKYFIESYKEHCSGYDLYVVDNGSRDGDIDYLSTYMDDKILEQFLLLGGNYLFTYAVNFGFEIIDLIETRGDKYEKHYDQIVIANPDIEFREGWDRDLESNKGIMGFVLVKPNGYIEHAGGIGRGEHLGRGERDTGQYQGIRDVDWVTFGAAAIARGAIKTLGDLNEDFPHFGSDREYCTLAKNKKIPVKCSGARLTHGFGKSTRPYIWEDIPDEIWVKHVAERHLSGVGFPENQKDCKRIDAPGRYMPLAK
jgi:GT2 family glycosyltransferase